MGILRTNEISGLETPTAVTGSVLFDGTGDYLEVPSTELKFANTDFTIECWIYRNTSSDGQIYSDRSTSGVGDWNGLMLGIRSNKVFILASTSGSGWNLDTYATTQGSEVLTLNWTHIALSKSGSTWRVFINGNLSYTSTLSGSIIQTQSVAWIGEDQHTTVPEFNGYISNLRILKGTALYTSNFTPPVHELQQIGDTVLLCCNNPDSAGAEATGKTITINGNAAASTVSPGLTRDFTSGTQFQGVAKFDTQGYFVPPSGTTEQRGRGRGIFALGAVPGTYYTDIQYVNIASQGNSILFGNLTGELLPGREGSASVSSETRGIFAGGDHSPAGRVNAIHYITLSTTGDSINFGDLSAAKNAFASFGSSTRGCFAGGTTGSNTNLIEYITIASLGDAQTFGDLTVGKNSFTGCSSSTRGMTNGGFTSSSTNVIEFVTIATTGDAQEFGDLQNTINNSASCSSSTRGISAGGATPTRINTIDYITIASTGDAQDFGDLTASKTVAAGTSNKIRGIFGGGGTPTRINTIDYITIASTGDAIDFGDFGSGSIRSNLVACSDSHGGLS